MKVVWKFELAPLEKHQNSQNIYMPRNSTVLDVQMQDGRPVFWATVDPETRMEERRFLLLHTGEEVSGYPTYIGTFQAGPTVWHLFEDFDEIPF